MADKVNREELALALKMATSLGSDASSPDQLSLDEAEEIAVEVGIPREQLRAALDQVRSMQLGRGEWLGPASMMSAEGTLAVEVSPREAARAIAEGQAGLPQIAQGASEVAPGVWRSSHRGTMLQISTDSLGTRVTAAADRGVLKAITIVSTTGFGGFLGAELGVLVSSVFMGEVNSAVAVAMAMGGVGGLASGFFSGVALWRASARAMQNRLYQAVEKMRGALRSDAETSLSVDP